jgi:gliding motility-associated-like protein
MWKFILFSLIFGSFSFQVISQVGGSSCPFMQPICTDAGIQFTASSGGADVTVSEPGNDYGCLGYSPNPNWYYFEISQPGSVVMQLSAPTDIDYVIWGPFANLAAAQAACGTYTNIVGDVNCVTDYFLGIPIGTTCDAYGCGYSFSSLETPGIPNAQVGEVYVMLITNYADNVQNISLTQTGGTGATDCTILTNSCSFTNIDGTITDCNGTTNQYTITGSVSFINAPSTGSLTVVNSCGGIQTFNAPFTGIVNYSFINTADGSPCTITASFSNDNSCSATLDFDAPPSCTCPADVGTYSYTVDGANVSPSSLIKLCYGEQLSITSNNNWTPPNEIIGATDPLSPNYDPLAPIYDPGIAWLVYSCPPSVSLTPTMSTTTGLSINNDPCLQGVIANSPSITDINDLSLINAFPAGTFTNNTVYLVPLTMYSLVDGIYSYIILPADPCFEMGAAVGVQYLPDVTYTQTQNCANGTVSATISGGDAQVNGTNFSIVLSSIVPSNAQLVNFTASNGGTIILGNLSTGPYSFNVEDANGCPVTISGTYTGAQTASINYLDDLYCLNDPNPSVQISGTIGGTFTSGPGLTINATTGLIDLITSTPGVYTITYTSPGPLCPGTDSYTITIEDYPIIDGGPDLTLCIGNQITLEGSGASDYTWNFGMQNGVPYLPNIGETQFVVIGSTSAGCIGADTVIVTVVTDCLDDEDVIFWVPNTFTPDNDEYNQSFQAVFYSGYDPFSFEMDIFNRWGELIWESNEVTVGWDGTYNNGMKVPDGVYTWKIKFKRKQDDQKLTSVGHVIVLR